MRLLVTHICIPDTFTHPTNGAVYTKEECFVVWLYHIIKGAPFTEMACFVFGRDSRQLSEMNDVFISYAYNAFYNKISGTSLNQWIPNKLNLCRKLILSSISSGAIEEIVFEDGQVNDWHWIRHHFDVDSFCIFGFLNDFEMATARPANSATRMHGFVENICWAFYSGYICHHSLKAQVVYLPIGIVGSIFITELCQNNNGLLNMSGLNDYLCWLLSGHFIRGLLPYIYCDGIFAIHPTILPCFINPTPAQMYLNLKFASDRQCIKHIFGDHCHNRAWRH
jgi:hypothetical protein